MTHRRIAGLFLCLIGACATAPLESADAMLRDGSIDAAPRDASVDAAAVCATECAAPCPIGERCVGKGGFGYQAVCLRPCHDSRDCLINERCDLGLDFGGPVCVSDLLPSFCSFQGNCSGTQRVYRYVCLDGGVLGSPYTGKNQSASCTGEYTYCPNGCTEDHDRNGVPFNGSCL